jgi:olfactory receptor
MSTGNFSSPTEFLLLGITNNAGIIVVLFTAFLAIYLIILVANLGMVTLIRMESHLHTPMYIFLSHLSLADFCYSTVVGPKMLVDLLARNKSVPFVGCALQFFIFCIFTDAECMLLAVMAFHLYKAISNPLLYTVDMSSKVCSQLLARVYLVAMADALTHTTLTFCLCFCGSHEINHFLCDVPLSYYYLAQIHRSMS